jgi:hypothetical protein
MQRAVTVGGPAFFRHIDQQKTRGCRRGLIAFGRRRMGVFSTLLDLTNSAPQGTAMAVRPSHGLQVKKRPRSFWDCVGRQLAQPLSARFHRILLKARA